MKSAYIFGTANVESDKSAPLTRCFLSPFATIVCGHPSGAPASRPRTDKTLRALHEPRFVPGEFPTPHEPARSTSHVSTSSIHAAWVTHLKRHRFSLGRRRILVSVAVHPLRAGRHTTRLCILGLLLGRAT